MTDDFSIDRRALLAGAAGLAAASGAGAQTPSTAPDLSGRSVLITGASSGFGRLSDKNLGERRALS